MQTHDLLVEGGHVTVESSGANAISMVQKAKNAQVNKLYLSHQKDEAKREAMKKHKQRMAVLKKSEAARERQSSKNSQVSLNEVGRSPAGSRSNSKEPTKKEGEHEANKKAGGEQKEQSVPVPVKLEKQPPMRLTVAQQKAKEAMANKGDDAELDEFGKLVPYASGKPYADNVPMDLWPKLEDADRSGSSRHFMARILGEDFVDYSDEKKVQAAKKTAQRKQLAKQQKLAASADRLAAGSLSPKYVTSPGAFDKYTRDELVHDAENATDEAILNVVVNATTGEVEDVQIRVGDEVSYF